MLLNDPDHTGTAVPILLALLILDRARRRWWVPVLVAAVLGWALVGDSLVLLIGVAPLVVVCGARAFGQLWSGGSRSRTRGTTSRWRARAWPPSSAGPCWAS